jgi:hypothetical protein
LKLDFENLPSGSVPAQVPVTRQNRVTIRLRGSRRVGLQWCVRPAVNPPKILQPRDETLMSPEDVDANGDPIPCRAAKKEAQSVES